MTVVIKKKAEIEQEALEIWRANARVTPYQAKAALLRAGLLDEVEAIMADETTPREVKLAWEYSGHFVRNSPLISALQGHPLLGLSDDSVDDIFRIAQSIE